MAATIDTLEIARELQDAGMPERQAEALARVFRRRYEADRQELVTREYLDAALSRQSAELHLEIERGRGETERVRGDIARLERDLSLKLGGIITVAVAIVGALGVLF